MQRSTILKEAECIVSRDRPNDYGPPEDSFERIAQLWTAYMGVDFFPADVAAMMALLKIARIKACPAHLDNWLDLAGYAACGGEIATTKKE